MIPYDLEDALAHARTTGCFLLVTEPFVAMGGPFPKAGGNDG